MLLRYLCVHVLNMMLHNKHNKIYCIMSYATEAVVIIASHKWLSQLGLMYIDMVKIRQENSLVQFQTQ